jgi:hypothetical protein
MGNYSLLSPIQVLDRKEKAPKDCRTRFHLNTEGLVFVYIDNFKNVFLPVFRVEVKSRDIQVDTGSDHEFYTGLELQVSLNNSRTAKWEPVVEPIYFDITYKTQGNLSVMNLLAGDLENPENLCINFSEELLESVMHCLNNAKSVIKASSITPEKINQKEEMIGGHFDPEEKIYESQFLIRNLTGYDFLVQTMGDKKGEPTLIRNLQEKFVSFILEDEFSVKDTSEKRISISFTDVYSSK